jgi:uncharacterized protein YgiM (DUF1202 family)
LRRSSLASALLVLLVSTAAPEVSDARDHWQVYITEPYLELHTGPGRGYPVFHVVAREESVEVLLHRTDWFKVRTARGVEGWAAASELEKSVKADGSAFTFVHGDRSGYQDHRFEAGMFAGQWGGATLISGYIGVPFNSQLSVEGSVGQVLGKFSTSVVGDLGFAHYFVPEWRLSPFVTIGTGLVYIEPKATVGEPATRTEPTAYVGAGLRYYLTRRFFVRAEYRSNFIFTKLNQNEVADEWKAGFAFFY